ncbi:MAG: hypothetical protein HY040_08930 [Planctomycetes bacterium]|nr:hypothetical protein [Planctomycetota bacterium]
MITKRKLTKQLLIVCTMLGYAGAWSAQAQTPAQEARASAVHASAEHAAGDSTDAVFLNNHKLIKPLQGEMAWRTEIPWLTNIQEAREKAAAEGKPILVWIAADGHPLGAT